MSVPPALHELEAEIMHEVWRLGRCSVREVLDALNARNETPRAYTTVMTVMHRLDHKGLLERERHGKTDVYAAALSRDEYARERAGEEVGAIVDVYGDLALAHFARQMSKLDPKRREQIRRLARGE